MAALDNVKLMLGIEDTLQDEVLNLLISNAESRLKIWFKHKTKHNDIPPELNFIVEELVVQRFNRLGSEGYSSESVEGRSISFSEEALYPYMDILDTYTDGKAHAGKVLFY